MIEEISYKGLLTPAWSPIQEANRLGLTGPRELAWFTMQHDLAKNLLIPAGRRSVKSLLARRGMVLQLPKPKLWDNPRFFISAPTRQQVKRIHWNSVQKLIPPHWIKRVWRSDLMIEGLLGWELWFVGLDAPARIEGDTDGWDGGLVDESADIRDPETIPAHIDPALATRDGFLWRIGVPDYKGPSNPSYEEDWNKCIVWDKYDKKRDDGGVAAAKALNEALRTGRRVEWLGFNWPSEDVMQPKQVRYFQKKLSPTLYKQELRGGFVSAPGRAYPGFDFDKHVKPTGYLPGYPIHVTCDFNFGYHNWLITQVGYPDKLEGLPFIRFTRQVFLTDSNTSKMIKELVRLLDEMDSSIITAREIRPKKRIRYRTAKRSLHFYGDFSGEQRHSDAPYSNWEQIKRAFPDARFHYKPQGPISVRIDELDGVLCSFDETARCQIDPHCQELINDFKTVSRAMLKSDNKTSRLTHASDAAGYLVVQLRKGVVSSHGRAVKALT